MLVSVSLAIAAAMAGIARARARGRARVRILGRWGCIPLVVRVWGGLGDLGLEGVRLEMGVVLGDVSGDVSGDGGLESAEDGVKTLFCGLPPLFATTV